jgi:ABC-2 type transport system permease protein
MNTSETNLSGAEVPAGTLTPPTSRIAVRPVLRILSVLVRREFWEHRALWAAPLLIAGLLIACAVPAHFNLIDFADDEQSWSHGRTRSALVALAQWGVTVPQFLVMVIVLSFYLTDCLYAERKDRSILFWKSLPVSDGLTVASKLLTALVVVPLGVYAVTIVTHLLVWGILVARSAGGTAVPLKAVWDTVVWLKVEALILYGVLVSIFWYAPMAAYLLLVSAWNKRNPFLWSALPPVFAIIIERSAFGTHYVTSLIQYRTVGIWEGLNLQNAAERTVHDGNNHLVSLPGIFDTLDVTGPFLNIDLWLGVAVAAGFAFVAARIRRYRDDT